ncbi:MAG: tetraacyldisaccharide 4'-kinase [candidate division Zixibacteria bacterium]|nr:tetraacyldisaccharide 4'-kinase [candidate division Zixibacteria bacterium]
MNKFWEVVVNSQGTNRFYCFPFLLLFRILTPIYQYFSRKNLLNRKNRCSREWKAKVISIGNITVGGSGKTPLILRLAKRFISMGKKVVIVHSGYGRTSKEDVIIPYNSKDEYTVNSIGDETAMMRVKLPQAGFAIGRDKKNILKRADRELAPDVVLIDDGYQRLDIEKDIDIALISPEILETNPDSRQKKRLRLFPSGILREPMKALSRADALFLFDFKENANEKEVFGKRVYHWRLAFEGISQNGKVISDDEREKIRPYLFTGIGSFDRMQAMIENYEITVMGAHNFGDHYSYNKLDFEMLRDLRIESKADSYLTTAKDLVKLPSEGLDKPVYCLELGVHPVDEGSINRLFGWE